MPPQDEPSMRGLVIYLGLRHPKKVIIQDKQVLFSR
jgi:hypothetical protein